MRLSAADCLRRGWTNLAANWELVVIQWLGSLLVAALLACGVVLALSILGLGGLAFGRASGREVEAALQRLGEASLPLLLALVAMAAVWLATLVLHCYFQAGTYGILTTAERQALPGPRRHRLLFRTFSRRDFAGWGALYVWRYCGLLALFGGLLLLMGAAVCLWLVLLAVGGGAWGAPAALGIGCGGALPMGFLAVVLGLWIHVAQADLARQGSGIRAAARRGLAVLGRRLGAVLGLSVLFLAAAAALAIAFLPLSLFTDSLLARVPAIQIFTRLVLVLLQTLPNALLTMALAGSLVALVRSEMPIETHPTPEVQTA